MSIVLSIQCDVKNLPFLGWFIFPFLNLRYQQLSVMHKDLECLVHSHGKVDKAFFETKSILDECSSTIGLSVCYVMPLLEVVPNIGIKECIVHITDDALHLLGSNR